MMLLAIFSLFFSLTVSADSMEVHKAAINELANKIAKHEKRTADLKKKKVRQHGTALDSTLNEIGELQKELLALRQKKTQLREHIVKEHPEEEAFFDLTFHQKLKTKVTKESKDDVDKKLDEAMGTLQEQYARALNDKIEDEDHSSKVELEAEKKKVRSSREVKEKYIEDTIKTEIKVD